MKIERIMDGIIRKMTIDEFKSTYQKISDENKSAVLKYLKKFPASAYTSAPVIDRITGKEVYDADNAHTDGKYTWYESEIYHFEKYNIKLKDEFINQVLSNKAPA